MAQSPPPPRAAGSSRRAGEPRMLCARCGQAVVSYWPPTLRLSGRLLCLACDPDAPRK
jgi:hypothetical protein